VSEASVTAPVGDAPLHELSRDALSAFLFAALLPEETLALVKSLRLSAPGFRTGGLSDVELCDLLADEVRVAPVARSAVLEALRTALKEPAFATSRLDPVSADELLEVAGSDHGLAIALWRLVADPQPEVRARGEAALAQLAADWFGPAPGGAGTADRGRPTADGEDGAAALAQKLQAAEERLARAEARAEEVRRKGEEARDKLQAQVKEARAEGARAVADAARSRGEADQARQARGRAEAELAQARATGEAAELSRLRGVAREADTARHAAEARGERLREQVATLEQALQAVEARAPEVARTSAGAGEDAEVEPEEAPASWLLPVFTEEFYDSLRGWDRRIQRAAVKQAFLLAQDHRHPSLRALPLGGIPGYYRVRVATDVRLIYRRDDGRQDAVEILSVIDREDLDRYVRQAKTR
jgi:mRNA-degrading endonuclease RelE of RelBE toxin-antitoxin system